MFLWVIDVIHVVDNLALVFQARFLSFLEFSQSNWVSFSDLVHVELADGGGFLDLITILILLNLQKGGRYFDFFFRLVIVSFRLCCGHLGVDTSFNIDEVIMSTILNNLAFLHHNDSVGILDSGQSVGDHKRCDGAKLTLHLINGSLNLSLILLVKSASCLIENEDTRFLDKGSGEGDSLLLTSGKLSASRSDVSVDTSRRLAHE